MSPINGLGTSLRSTRSKYTQTTWQIVRAPQDAASSIQNNRVGLGLALAFTRKTTATDKMRKNSMTIIDQSERKRARNKDRRGKLPQCQKNN